MTKARRVAFITGASRGVGKATAVALADAGFDVVIAARTQHEGDGYDVSPEGRRRTLPGSLESTAQLVRQRGREVLPLHLDLSQSDQIEASVARVLDEWGRIDVLVNNAMYSGQGHTLAIRETSMALLNEEVRVNMLAPLQLVMLMLPHMLDQGYGTIVNVTSAAGYMQGCFNFGAGYSMSKAELHRLAGVLAHELAGTGVVAYNVHPAQVTTERMALHLGAQSGVDNALGAPPEVCAAVIAWVATSPEASTFNGRTIESQTFCIERELLPEWKAHPDAPSLLLKTQ